MKFLIDVNPSPQLCRWLRDRGHEAEHVSELSLLTATDSKVWERGRDPQAIILRKDIDFYDRAMVLGAPPQVLHIAVGNCSNAQLLEILDSAWQEIETVLSTASELVSVTQGTIEVFP